MAWMFRNKLLRTTILPFAILCFASTLWSFLVVFSGLFMFFSLVFVACYWIACIIRLLSSIFSRNWYALVLRCMALIISIPLALAGLRSGDYLHFAIMYPWYIYTIEHSIPGPIHFGWGDYAFGLVAPLDFKGILYDNGSELYGPEENHISLEDGFNVSREKLIGNFYIEHIN